MDYYASIKNVIFPTTDLDWWLLCIEAKHKTKQMAEKYKYNDPIFVKMNWGTDRNDWPGFKDWGKWELGHSLSFPLIYCLISKQDVQRSRTQVSGYSSHHLPGSSWRSFSTFVSCGEWRGCWVTRTWNTSPLPFQILRLEEGATSDQGLVISNQGPSHCTTDSQV